MPVGFGLGMLDILMGIETTKNDYSMCQVFFTSLPENYSLPCPFACLTVAIAVTAKGYIITVPVRLCRSRSVWDYKGIVLALKTFLGATLD